MKKQIASILSLLVVIGAISGCAPDTTSKKEEEKLSVVTTIFPEYDWVNEIVGENIEHVDVTMLLDNGVDFHSYQPTADDIVTISTCDMFIYVGGESGEWVDEVLKEATNEEMVVLDLLEVLGDEVKEEELVDGMEHEHEEHEHESQQQESEPEEHEHEGEIDEHVWLSLRNAETVCDAIADELAQIDSDHADEYQANAQAYIKELEELDAHYRTAVENGERKTVVFGDRFPFRYLFDDYGLSYYAAFPGCSAETEASFETVMFLANKVDELSLPCVLTIEGGDHKIAETVIVNTKDKDQQIISMDSMQSVTAVDVENGATYLSIMENNLNVLKEALK